MCAGAVGVVILGAAAIGLGVVAAKGVTRYGRYGDVRHRSVEGSGDGGGTATADLLVERHSVLIGRPLGVEVQDGVVIRGEVADALLVGIEGAVAIGLCVPAGEGVARAAVVVSIEGLRYTVGEALVGHRASGVSVVFVEADGISVGDEIGAYGHCTGGHGERVTVDGAGVSGESYMVAGRRITVVGEVKRGRGIGVWLSVDIGTVVVSDVAAARQGG